MERRKEGLRMICGVISVSMAVVIIILASAFIFTPHIEKSILETLFVCGAVENVSLAVRYLSIGRKKGWGFLFAALLLAGSAFLIFI